MRKILMVAMVLVAGSALPAMAEALKAYKLTVDGVAVDIDPGEEKTVTLPDGKQATIKLERNEFATFSGDSFAFVHPSTIPVTKTDLTDGITQYLMASALGTIVVVQEYAKMNPVSLNQLMLQEMTKESVQAGATVTQKPATRKLADGKELTGITATVQTRTDTTDFEILGFGTTDQGLIMISRIDRENAKTEQPLIDRFWESLEINL